MPTTLILFAHGSRDPAWSQPFERLAERVRHAAPDSDVRLAYLEAMKPSLPEAAEAAVAAGASSIRIVPMFQPLMPAKITCSPNKMERDAPGNQVGRRFQTFSAHTESQKCCETGILGGNR